MHAFSSPERRDQPLVSCDVGRDPRLDRNEVTLDERPPRRRPKAGPVGGVSRYLRKVGAATCHPTSFRAELQIVGVDSAAGRINVSQEVPPEGAAQLARLSMLEQQRYQGVAVQVLAQSRLPGIGDEQTTVGQKQPNLLRAVPSVRNLLPSPPMAGAGSCIWRRTWSSKRLDILSAGFCPSAQGCPPPLQLAYVEITTTGGLFGPGQSARGHLFHRSEISEDHEATRCYRLQTSRDEIAEEGDQHDNVLASYVHLHFASEPRLATAFVRRCEEFQAPSS